MAISRKKIIIWIAAIAAACAIGGGAYYFVSQNQLPVTNVSEETSDSSDKITLAEGVNRISSGGTYTLTGTISNGYIHVNTEDEVELILDGVSITYNSGPAIYIEGNGNTTITLVGENSLNSRPTEDLNGAIYSKADLDFSGDGSLEITSTLDGIVSKDDLKIKSGTYKITSDDDGIVGKDSVKISGGNFTINAGDDGIKSSEDTNAEKGYVKIDDGTLTISAGDDGIQGVSSVTINGGTIDIKTSAEGIEATNVTINGGTIKIYATDDGINAALKGTGGDIFIRITGGEISISMAQGDTDAIDSNGDIYVSGGTIKITAQSAFDSDGSASFTGGTIYVNGSQISSITNSMMDGGIGGSIGIGVGGPDGARR